jgi:hypothetical protein
VYVEGCGTGEERKEERGKRKEERGDKSGWREE